MIYDINKCKIEQNAWEDNAQDRSKWRILIRNGATIFEDARVEDQLQKHLRKKNPDRAVDIGLMYDAC